MLSIPEFKIFRRDRQRGGGGGVLLYKDNIICTELQLSQESDFRSIGLDISLSPRMSFVITGIYPLELDN